MDAQALAMARDRALAGDAALAPALQELRQNADKALIVGPYSVIDKQQVPPSGDKHDYLSLSIYWWPNPDSADGLPYVNRDGQINPQYQTDSYDATSLVRMVSAVETLALGNYLLGVDAYAARAGDLLRTWFLGDATRMNPNFRYAQVIPGYPDQQRGVGIIESRVFMRVVDAAGLLDTASSWESADQASLRSWFGQFFRWLQESADGRRESQAPNNHGTWYDA